MNDIAWRIPGEAAFDRIEELREYLENFPTGIFSDAARNELKMLEELSFEGGQHNGWN